MHVIKSNETSIATLRQLPEHDILNMISSILIRSLKILESILLKTVSPTYKDFCVPVLFFGGCVAARSTRKITQVVGEMDSSKHQQILEANVTESVKKLQLKSFYSRAVMQNIRKYLP